MCEPRRRDVRRAWLQGHLEHSLLGSDNSRIPRRAGRFGDQSEAEEGLSLIRKARSRESGSKVERSIHVAKLLRAHGGCLGVRGR